MLARQLLLFALASAWCLVLLSFRIYFSGSGRFAFLAWNLFLAAIPLVLTIPLMRTDRRALGVGILGLWLLFFPNAPYVITDLIHLRPRTDVPHWFDLMLIFSFAATCLFAGFHSLQNVQEWITRHFNRWLGWGAVFGTLLLSGFGIYLGRFLRWNSWDIFARPFDLLADIAHRFADPLSHPRTWGITIGYGVLLSILYLMSFPARKDSRPQPVRARLNPGSEGAD